MVRLGVLSFAHGHVHAYLNAIAAMDDAEAVGGWDDDTERGQTACAQHNITFEPDLDRLLGREDIDAVFVTSQTNRHAELVLAAAQAGKAVLLQKPMALTLADCDVIINTVETYQVGFSMCYQMRCDPVNQKMKQLVDDGAVGRIAVVRRRHAIPMLLNADFARPGNWHIDPVANMGMFMDDASHAADWFYWMLGRPVSVMAEIDNVITDVAPDDNGVALFRFADKEIGVLLNSSTMLAAEATTEIYGDEGVIVQNYGDLPSSSVPRPPSPIALKLYRTDNPRWVDLGLPADTRQGDRIAAVARPVVDYLHGLRGPLATAADGKVCIEMILAAYRSATEGRRITL